MGDLSHEYGRQWEGIAQSRRRSENLSELQREAHAIAKEHGWWDEERTFGELIALVHSELSEALEAYRDEVLPSKPHLLSTKVASELADVVIRVADMAEWFKIDLAKSLEEDEDLGEAKQAYLEYRLSGNLDSFGEWIGAIHEDMADAGYHQRNGGDNMGSHLVAVISLVQDMAAHYGIDLDAAIKAKMEYNRGRSYRHGGKAL